MPRLCPACRSPDLPFGGEAVCDCPDDDVDNDWWEDDEPRPEARPEATHDCDGDDEP